MDPMYPGKSMLQYPLAQASNFPNEENYIEEESVNLPRSTYARGSTPHDYSSGPPTLEAGGPVNLSDSEGYLPEDNKASRKKKTYHEVWPELDEDYYLGPHENFDKFGLTCASHPEEKFVTAHNHCCIQMYTTQQMKTASKLTYFSDESKHLADYVFPQRRDHAIAFDIIFPDSGYYLFEIYAKPANYRAKQLVNVYNYLIKVQNKPTIVFNFPKRFAHWRDGCYLYEPVILNSQTAQLDNVKFRVHITGARKAAVVIDKMVWHHLEQREDEFEGCVDMERYRHKNVKVVVEANYSADNKYIPLLEYRI